MSSADACEPIRFDMQTAIALTAQPESLIYGLPSILERIDLAKMFAKVQPLEVELGSGDGSFLAEYARLHPERNFIGVERLLCTFTFLIRGRSGSIAGIALSTSVFPRWRIKRSRPAAGSICARTMKTISSRWWPYSLSVRCFVGWKRPPI